MKRVILNLLSAGGAFSLLRFLNRRRGLILTYHRFSQEPEGGKTSARAFAEQLAYLTAHYQLVPLSQMLEQLSIRGELTPGLAAITIDDGYRDAAEIAFPLLQRYQAPATLYVVTEFIERGIWLWTDKLRFLTTQTRSSELKATISGRELRCELSGGASRLAAAELINTELKQLDDEAKDEAINVIAAGLQVDLPETPPAQFGAITWEQAREMDRQGLAIESHTLTHPILTNLGDQRLRRELRESREQLETRLRRRVEHFCYPNGDFDERVRRAVAEAGYASAVTCLEGMNVCGEDPLVLRRIHTADDLQHFTQSTSGFELVKARLRQAMGQRTGATEESADRLGRDAEKCRPAL